jgi:hypothetical protein
MLLDSNIIIYAAQPEHAALRQFIETHTPAVSVISYIEVLGYYKGCKRKAPQSSVNFAPSTKLRTGFYLLICLDSSRQSQLTLLILLWGEAGRRGRHPASCGEGG